MYQIKNGILYRDGKPTLGIGVSYYASYHPEKRTLPPGADAIGEMRLDVRDMAQAGGKRHADSHGKRVRDYLHGGIRRKDV